MCAGKEKGERTMLEERHYELKDSAASLPDEKERQREENNNRQKLQLKKVEFLQKSSFIAT